MILGSHNSWTYLRPRSWWMHVIRWTARCQNATIKEQYESGVRCFDLRLKFTGDGSLKIAHGLVVYKYSESDLLADLSFLDGKEDCSVRVIHEVRRKSEKTREEEILFQLACERLVNGFPNITFFCGRNLVDWAVDYEFRNHESTIDDAYGSVMYPNTIFALWPWSFAKLYNHIISEKGTEKEILMMDFIKKQEQR